MDIELVVDFLAFAALWGALSPLVMQLVKNVGKLWPVALKKGIAVAFAAVGAFIAFGTQSGWASVDLLDLEGFWYPLVAALGMIYPIAYASYAGFWKGTALSDGLGNTFAVGE
jgi:hypothetical protein